MTKEPQLFSRDYFWLLSGRLMPLLALFGVTIIFSHGLSLDNYAVFQSIWMYANLLNVIIGFGITTVIFSTSPNTFFTFLRSNKKVIVSFYSVLWVVSFLIFALLSQHFTLAMKLWLSGFIIIQTANTITETWLIKNDGEWRYFIINFIYAIAFLAWHLWIFNVGFSIEYLVKGIILISLLKFIAVILCTTSTTKEANVVLNETTLFSHWTYNGINDILGIVSKWIDKLILILLLTPAQFAIFFNGSIEIPLFSILIGLTGSFMMMRMVSGLKDSQSILSIFRDSFLMLSAIVFPLFFFFFFFREPVFITFFGEKYLASLPVFVITILILPIRINHYGSILQVFGKGKVVTQGSVIDLVLATLLVFILYPVMGMQGAALALLISTICQVLFYLWKTSQILHCRIVHLIPLNKLIPRFVIVGIIFGILQFAIKSQDSLLQVITGIIMVFICAIIVGEKYFKSVLRGKVSK